MREPCKRLTSKGAMDRSCSSLAEYDTIQLSKAELAPEKRNCASAAAITAIHWRTALLGESPGSSSSSFSKLLSTGRVGAWLASRNASGGSEQTATKLYSTTAKPCKCSSLNISGNAALVIPKAPLQVASTGPTSFPGKLQQAAETVKETKAEPTQPRRKKLADKTQALPVDAENGTAITDKAELPIQQLMASLMGHTSQSHPPSIVPKTAPMARPRKRLCSCKAFSTCIRSARSFSVNPTMTVVKDWYAIAVKQVHARILDRTL
mmetsp:Transcript_7542/g.17111  ORF Transcript_7542/g.17111 Transcript_7542/m.17111 type:complete len:265 (-) Transcript_7542:92-886(-)